MCGGALHFGKTFIPALASLQQCLFDESSDDDDVSKQEVVDEENKPKSRKLNDQENVTTEVDTTSTVRDCQILSSDSYTNNKDKLFINTGMSSKDADAKACCSQLECSLLEKPPWTKVLQEMSFSH